MRYLISALMLVSMTSLANSGASGYDPVQFEKRFRQADKGNKGKLTRAEAYAEFPRAPEFFDEMDANKDGFVTLEEVRQTVDRWVSAAVDASGQAKRYGNVDAGPATSGAPASAEQEPAFASRQEEERYRRQQYYESLATDKTIARDRGEPVSKSPSSPLFNKSF